MLTTLASPARTPSGPLKIASTCFDKLSTIGSSR